jgi:hypothetical protein
MKKFLKRLTKKEVTHLPVDQQISRRTAISFTLFFLANVQVGWVGVGCEISH